MHGRPHLLAPKDEGNSCSRNAVQLGPIAYQAYCDNDYAMILYRRDSIVIVIESKLDRSVYIADSRP